MALSQFLDEFQWNSADAVGTKYARSGYGFTPKAGLVFVNGRTETVDTVGSATHRFGFGWFAKPNATIFRQAMGSASADNVATVDAGGLTSPTAVLAVPTTGGAIDGLLDIDTVDADGITFIVDDAIAADIRVFVIAWGGDDLTDGETGELLPAAGAGNKSITNTRAFQPDVFINYMARKTTVGQGAMTDSGLSFGATAGSLLNGVWDGVSDDAVMSNTVTWRYCNDIQCVAFHNNPPSATAWRAQWNAWLSNGVELNYAEAAAAWLLGWLMLKGGKWTVKSSATRTDLTPFSVSGFGFAPKGCIIWSHGKAESADDVIDDHELVSFGCAVGTASQRAVGMKDRDAITTNTQVTTAINYGECYVRVDVTTDTVVGTMKVDSFDSDGITFSMVDADPDAAFFNVLAWGDSAAPPSDPYPAGYKPVIEHNPLLRM